VLNTIILRSWAESIGGDFVQPQAKGERVGAEVCSQSALAFGLRLNERLGDCHR